MKNFEERLNEYTQETERLLNKKLEEYENFGVMEVEYCKTINARTQLRKELLENPELCDKGTYLFLTNQLLNTSAINPKFKGLINILKLTQKLCDNYLIYVKELEGNGNFEEAINIYHTLYKFTNIPTYEQSRADIIFSKLNNPELAFSIYKELENKISTPSYWEKFAELHKALNHEQDYEYCKRKAIEIAQKKEAHDAIDNKEYEKAIKLYSDLYTQTGNTWYRMEVANINAVLLKNISLAIEIYKELESKLKDDKDYWFKFSELYEHKENYFKQVVCLKRAIELELAEDAEKGCEAV